ncbi:transcription termination factor Rho [Candidatus Dojkabacteria bacterium]|uniref:Transcription termination factor Rho n=1 Tax=Candidatus Dojkabacteria bacterium TaxID=2099670 RepID=A0A3M0Z3Y1_9BACT|nr:MAG: transcription termination factor Rho [Candidatus Dojkabacteria bacterium]
MISNSTKTNIVVDEESKPENKNKKRRTKLISNNDNSDISQPKLQEDGINKNSESPDSSKSRSNGIDLFQIDLENSLKIDENKNSASLDKNVKSKTDADFEEKITTNLRNKDTIVQGRSIKDLEVLSILELRKIAESLNIKNVSDYKKNDLLLMIVAEETKRGGNIFAEGFLEIVRESHGVLRSSTMLPGENDVYVSPSQIKRFGLRPGDFVSGQARSPKEGERYLSLLRIEAVNNMSPEASLTRPNFNSLTPIYPNTQIKLETESHILSTRIIDLISPIGKGQRSMIVAPPKVGKTWLLKDIAHGIATNHPEIHIIVLLVGERPEEVTDMQRSVKGEVIAANFDEPPELHAKISEMAIERAKRLVELGKDVVILMDSITRLARAYNIIAPPSGRTLSGGFDPVAIYPPKKFFGAARNMENGGSLTIIATALVDTGSKMDEVIFEEFKGTGNMEVKLDRKLAERRIFPAIDVSASYTRNEDKLLDKEIITQVYRVIRMLDVIKSETSSNPTEVLINRLKKTKNNKEFLATLHETM